MHSITGKIFRQKETVLISLIILFFTIIFAFVNIQKHHHFQTFAWDTAVFDQQIYLASIGKTPFSSLHGMNGLADHFHPLLLLFGAGIYKFQAKPEALFILQSIIISLSGWPLFLITKRLLQPIKINQKSKIILSLLVTMMYLAAVAVQAMTLDEIHDDVLASLPIMLLLYTLMMRKWRWFWISFFWLLLTKEEYGLLGIPLGLIIFLKTKKWRTGLFVAVTGFCVFIFLTSFLMPKLGGSKNYIHFLPENQPETIARRFLLHPQLFISKFFDQSAKRFTIFSSLASFGFLPLVSGWDLLLPISSLTIRFYDDTTIRRYEFNNHYASPFMPLLAVAAAVGLSKILIFLINRKVPPDKAVYVTGIYVFITIFAQDIIFHGPLNSILKPGFYKSFSWESDAYKLINQVPPNVTLASQNSLLPHLSQRENFYLLPEIGDSDYIAVDLADGPNKFAALNSQMVKNQIDELVTQNKYKIIWQKNQSLLLQKL